MLKYLFYIIIGIILCILINSIEKFNIGGLNPDEPCMSESDNCERDGGICIEENINCVCTLQPRGFKCIDMNEQNIGGRCPDGICNPGSVCISGICREGGRRPNIVPQVNPEAVINLGTIYVSFLPEFVEGQQEPLIPNQNNPAIKEYTIDAIEKFKTYETNLNLVRLNKFDDSRMDDIEYISQYCYDFILAISEFLSNTPYPNDYSTFNGIPRPNHGVVNHIRCFTYGSFIINLLRTNYPDVSRVLFPNNKKLAIMLLSTMFESIMRIDEQGSGGVLNSISEEYFNEIYPGLDYDIFRNLKLSPHQFASSIFYKVIMGHCFFNNNFTNIELQNLSMGVAFHWSYAHDIINIHSPVQLTIEDINGDNYLKFFMEYILIIIGHYADHCRLHLNGYNMIKQQEFRKFYEIIGLTGENSLNDFSKFIVKLLNLTQSCKLINIESVNYMNIVESCKDSFIHPNTGLIWDDKCEGLDIIPRNRNTPDVFKYLSIPFNIIEQLRIKDITRMSLNGFENYEEFIDFYNQIVDSAIEVINLNCATDVSA